MLGKAHGDFGFLTETTRMRSPSITAQRSRVVIVPMGLSVTGRSSRIRCQSTAPRNARRSSTASAYTGNSSGGTTGALHRWPYTGVEVNEAAGGAHKKAVSLAADGLVISCLKSSYFIRNRVLVTAAGVISTRFMQFSLFAGKEYAMIASPTCAPNVYVACSLSPRA